MADFIKTPFKDRIFTEKTSSDYEGARMAGGDIRVGGSDVVIMGPAIADEPVDLSSDLADWTGRAK